MKSPAVPVRAAAIATGPDRPCDLCWADLVHGLRESLARWDRILVTGESGVGKRTIVHEVLNAPERPVRDLDCAAVAEIGAQQWLAVARMMLSATTAEGAPVLVSHLESLSSSQARALGRILDQLPRGADHTRIIGTFTPTSAEPSPSMRALLDRFHTEPFDIPPLRRRQADIRQVLSGHGTTHPALSAEAAEQIRHYPWMGNYRQLNEFRLWLEGQSHPVVDLADLPTPWSRGATRARLSAIQAAEADAIEMALHTTHGNKAAAAAALGLSRSSLYRKMRAYRLT